MDNFFQTVVFGMVRTASDFYHSPFFSVIKFLIGIYVIVLLADIVLLLIQRGLAGDVRDTILGVNIPPELITKKGALRKKWDLIRKRLESENESEYKVAVIEADNIIDDLIRRMGYGGDNMTERLDKINPGQIENVEDLRKAHKLRNRIIHEDDFKLSRMDAEEALAYYEKFLHEFEVFG